MKAVKCNKKFKKSGFLNFSREFPTSDYKKSFQ